MLTNHRKYFESEKPKGRFDLINFKTNKIIVDYAHTPESISQVIKYVNPYFSKVVVLFGAGGIEIKKKENLWELLPS